MEKRLRGLWLCLLAFTISGQICAKDLSQADKIRNTVVHAYLADDFAAIDALANQYRTEKSRTPSGLWNLTVLYSGLGQAMFSGLAKDVKTGTAESEAHWSAIESKTNRWMVSSPGSPVAPIAHSMALVQHGWFYRGEGLANSVTPRGSEQFARYIGLAREVLEKNRKISSGDPTWYQQMLVVARTQGWDAKLFKALVDEGISREPLFYQTYFSAANYLLPQWGGSIQEIEAFADSAVLRTQSTEGKGMYARIFWAAYQNGLRSSFLKEKTIWPKMKEGFDDVMNRYPDVWNKHAYAKFACMAGDIAVARKLFREIGDAPWQELGEAMWLEAWGPSYFEKCRAWVASIP